MWLKHCFAPCQVAILLTRSAYIIFILLFCLKNIKRHNPLMEGGHWFPSGKILKKTRDNVPQAVRWESKYQTFQYILTICLTVRQLAVQQKRTFSPWMPGMASRKLLKLSFMWSLLFRSKALWCALLSNCRWKIQCHVNTGIIFFLCMRNSLWCLKDTQSKSD